MNDKQTFYNSYHKKNDNYFNVINDGNFTYFYLLKFIQKALKRIKVDIKSMKTLDVGCGVGTLAFYIANKGYNVTGIDVSSRAIDICNHYKRLSKMKNLIFINSDVTNRKILKGKFDLVLCTEVIEHIEDDSNFLSAIGEIINKDGYLILSTPSKRAPLYRLGLLSKFDYEVGHLRRYTIEDIEKLISGSGFSVIESRKVEGLLRNMLFTLNPFGVLIKFIRGPLIPLFHFIDQLVTKLLGESDLLILAQKK